MVNRITRFIICLTLFLIARSAYSSAVDKDSIIVFSGSLISTSKRMNDAGLYLITHTYKIDEQYCGLNLDDTVSILFYSEFSNEPYEYFSRNALVVAGPTGDGVFITGFNDYRILPLARKKDGSLVAICDDYLTSRYPIFKENDTREADSTKIRAIKAERLADYIIHTELFPEPNIPLLSDVDEERAKNHGYVDLGLSVLWATCNLGADNEYESGSYFSWGETQEKGYYTSDNYKWSLSKGVVTKYGKTGKLDIEDDAARYWWGDDWRIPTIQELAELSENCTWIKLEDQKGYIGVSKINGRSIIFPMTGVYEEYLKYKGKYSVYSSDYMSSNGNCGMMEHLHNMKIFGAVVSYYGFCIRPVRNR